MASAAKEIKALIDDSMGKVDAGSRLIEQAANLAQVVGVFKIREGSAPAISSTARQLQPRANPAPVKVQVRTQPKSARPLPKAAATKRLAVAGVEGEWEEF